MEMTAAEAATQLGITERRVRQLLADGQLAGRRLGKLWLVPSDNVTALAARRAPAGRPLGPRRAWGLLDLLDGGTAPWLAPAARAQLRASMRKYVDADPNRWRSALAGRSRVLRCQIHPAALPRLLDRDGVLAAGAAVASGRGFDLVVADNTVDRVHVDRAAWPNLSQRLAIRTVDSGGSANLTVTLPDVVWWPFIGRDELPDAALAADLLDDLDARVERAGAARLNELLRTMVTP